VAVTPIWYSLSRVVNSCVPDAEKKVAPPRATRGPLRGASLSARQDQVTGREEGTTRAALASKLEHKSKEGGASIRTCGLTGAEGTWTVKVAVDAGETPSPSRRFAPEERVRVSPGTTEGEFPGSM